MAKLTHKEMEMLEHLKTKTVNKTAEAMAISSSNVYSTLFIIRSKYGECRQLVNVIDSLKGSNQRLGKLLRRQEG